MVVIPSSFATVVVSAIDTATRINFINSSTFIEPADTSVSNFVFPPTPAYSFLVEHGPTGQKVLFDLGIRKDLQNLAPRNQKFLASSGLSVTGASGTGELSDVFDLLDQEGKTEVDGIIWSHWHWDHSGDPRRFPQKSELIVGPGFQDKLLPGYPTNPESGITEDAWRYGGRKPALMTFTLLNMANTRSNRTLHELNFTLGSSGLHIGGFPAIDYFGDGSFYVLSTPGHAVGHVSALARTTASPDETFAFLGADICHHGSLFRPTQYTPLPEQFVSNGWPERTTPYFTFPHVPDGTGVAANRSDAVESEGYLEHFDADDRIMVFLAHDHTLSELIDLFPKNVNNWKKQGWKKRGQWLFMSDLNDSLNKHSLHVCG